MAAITLYQLHTPDPAVPIEETIGALADMKAAGKVLHIGVSNVDRGQIDRALSVARIESVQNRCNPWAHEYIYNLLLAHFAHLAITYIPLHPVCGDKGHRSCSAALAFLVLAKIYAVSPSQLLLSCLLALAS